jgi:hypothetical protein
MLRTQLDDTARTQLQALRRTDLEPAAHNRLEMVLLSDAGWSAPRIAVHLGCHPHTARTALRLFRQHGAAGFARAAGDVEFRTDGTLVNTWEGWRGLRLGVFSRRAQGRPAAADAWGTRVLPPPHPRTHPVAHGRGHSFSLDSESLTRVTAPLQVIAETPGAGAARVGTPTRPG